MNKTLTNHAYEGLREKLARGELKPGQQLVNRTIAKELKISQTPLREAINRLASEGMVEYIPGGGAYVRTLTREDMIQLYELREQLEPYAAAMAARNASQFELDELADICTRFAALIREIRANPDKVATPRQMSRWSDAEEQFHQLLIRASRNQWLEMIANNLRLMSLAFSPRRDSVENIPLRIAAFTWLGHMRIVRAVKHRKPELASALMASHIRAGKRHCMDYFQRLREKIERE